MSFRTVIRKGVSQKSTESRAVGDIWKYAKRDPAVREKALRHAWAKVRCSCQWLETQGTATEHLILVKKWRDSTARKTDITSYFAFSQYACAYSIIYNYMKFLVTGISELWTVPGPKLPG